MNIRPSNAQTTNAQATSVTAASKQAEKLEKLATEFEGMFLQIMTKSMRNAIQKSDLMHGGNAEEIFQSMLDGESAMQMARQGNSGLAQQLSEQLKRMSGLQSYREMTQKASELKNNHSPTLHAQGKARTI